MAPEISTPAILLRRSEYGDFDLILTCLTLSQGKMSMLAKYAKKSKKRFAGALELFTKLDLVWSRPRGRAMPILREASVSNPFAAIRSDVLKTAYASYWTEMINLWLESGTRQDAVFDLLHYALDALDRETLNAKALSVIFQVRFLNLAGILPDFRHCSRCRNSIETMRSGGFGFDIAKGGLICPSCQSAAARGRRPLSKGSIMQLRWVAEVDLRQAERMRFGPRQLSEATALLEAFIPYHMGRFPRSLKFLSQIRPSTEKGI